MNFMMTKSKYKPMAQMSQTQNVTGAVLGMF